MKEWLARYSREFSNLVDNISHNVIEETSNQKKLKLLCQRKDLR